MKVVIDIPKMAYDAYKEWDKNKVATVEQSIIADGTPLLEGEWISVDATLPKYTGLYLVSIDALVTVANFDGTTFRYKGTSVSMAVDAWQPLPKSYKNAED